MQSNIGVRGTETETQCLLEWCVDIRRLCLKMVCIDAFHVERVKLRTYDAVANMAGCVSKSAIA